MKRFVVLTHDHPFLHWDFMLEGEGTLRTWRLAIRPDSGGAIDAEALPDHRLLYLDYEGPVSGNRGSVTRWDVGTFAPIESTAECVRGRVCGVRLNGEFSLRQSCEPSKWIFRIERPSSC